MSIARIIALCIFWGLGAMLLWVGVTQFFLQRQLLRAARPIEVEIVRSEVKTSTTRDTDRRVGFSSSTTTHTPDILFRYSIDGVVYESDMLHANIIGSSGSESSARDIVEAYPVGTRADAFVDPSRPHQAFLRREGSQGPLVFMVVGTLLLPLTWFASKLV